MFLRIGDTGFNSEHIRTVDFEPEERRVTVIFLGDPKLVRCFAGDKYDQFMDWWNNKADAYTCPEMPDAPF
jgi:hypothetical protein